MLLLLLSLLLLLLLLLFLLLVFFFFIIFFFFFLLVAHTRARAHTNTDTDTDRQTCTHAHKHRSIRLFARLCCRPRYSNAGEGLAHPSVLRPDHGRSRHLSQSCLSGDATTRLESKQWEPALLPSNVNLASQRPRQRSVRVATSS